MRAPIRTIALLTTSLAALVASTASAQSTADFRVLPYQMNPALDGMQFTWFTINDTPGTITVTGPGLKAPVASTSSPVLVPVLFLVFVLLLLFVLVLVLVLLLFIVTILLLILLLLLFKIRT